MILSTIVIVILVVATAAISQFRSMFSLLNVIKKFFYVLRKKQGTPLEKLSVVGGIPYFQLVPTIILIILKTLIPIIINGTQKKRQFFF